MSTLQIPGPSGDEPKPLDQDKDRQDDGNSNGHSGAADNGDDRCSREIPDVQACLQAMAQLPGLVALNVLKPAQANSIRASYREILQYHQKSKSQHGHDGLSPPDVLELARKDPRIFSMLEPILSDQQIKMAMKDAEDGGRGQD